MRRLTSIFVLCLAMVAGAVAQNYTITGEVEPVVHVGENFKLRYTLNSSEARNFTLGQIPDAFDVLIGPSQSTSRRVVSVNGNTTTTETMTLTYVLSANETGKFTFPAATAVMGGRTVKSAPLTVQVIAANERATGSKASADNFFVLVTASKRRVVENEPLLLTFKVCWHPDLPVINLDAINLELQDVYMQPYNDTQQKSKKVETIGGRTLVTVDWQQYVVYPQKAGTFHIPSLKIKGYIREDLPFDPFDPLSAGYREVPRQLTTPALDIQVDELPERPADFSGGVGRFTVSASQDKAEVKENQPLSIHVKVSGQGNLSMLNEPLLTFPRGFDTYDTKQTEDFQLTAEGLQGSVDYEFIAVPQRKGEFAIPPATFTYYDTGSRQYRTLLTDSFLLKVLPGEGTADAVGDYSGPDEQRSGDIRDIRRGNARQAGSHAFFASAPYFIVVGVLALLLLGLLVLSRVRSFGTADAEKARGKRANSVARRKLRKAARLMKEGRPDAFYEETLRALWGYVGDKLNIPVEQLSRDNISTRLQERGVDDKTTTLFLEAIDECEFVRYAPGDPQGNMSRVYGKSVSAIEEIERNKNVKKKKSK